MELDSLQSVTKPRSPNCTTECDESSQLATSVTSHHSTESDKDIVPASGSSEDQRLTAAEDKLHDNSENSHQTQSETDLMQFGDDTSVESVQVFPAGVTGKDAQSPHQLQLLQSGAGSATGGVSCEQLNSSRTPPQSTPTDVEGKSDQISQPTSQPAGEYAPVGGESDVQEQLNHCRPPSPVAETTDDKEQTVKDSCVVSTDDNAVETLCVKQTLVERSLSVVTEVSELENVEKCLWKLLDEEVSNQICLVEACMAVKQWETQHEDCNNNSELTKITSTMLDEEMQRRSCVLDELKKMLQNTTNQKICQQHKQHEVTGEHSVSDVTNVQQKQQGVRPDTAAAAAAASADDAGSAGADFELVDRNTCEDIQQGSQERKSMAEELCGKVSNESIEVEKMKKWLDVLMKENHDLKVKLRIAAEPAADRQNVELQLTEKLKEVSEREKAAEQQLEQLRTPLECCQQDKEKQLHDLMERLQVACKKEIESITMLREVEQCESNNLRKELEQARETEHKLNTELGETKAKLEQQIEELKQVQYRLDETLAHTTQTVQQLQLQLNESTQHDVQLLEDFEQEKVKTGNLLQSLGETVRNELHMQVELNESLEALKRELEGCQQVEELEEQLEQETGNVVHINDVLLDQLSQQIIDGEDELKRLMENEDLSAKREQLAQTEKVEERIKAELEQIRENIEKLTANYDELQANQNSLNEMIKQKKQEVNKLNLELKQVEWNQVTLPCRIADETQRAASLLSTGNFKALQALQVDENNGGAEMERCRLEDTVEQSLDRQREMEVELEKCSSELAELQGRTQSAERELAEMTFRFEHGFRDNEEKTKLEMEKQDKLQKQFERVTEQRERLKAELTPVDARIATLTDDVVAFTEDKTKLEETIKLKSRRIETLKSQLKETRHNMLPKYPQLLTRAGKALDLSRRLLQSLTGVRGESLDQLSGSLEKLMSFKSDLESKMWKQSEILDTELNLMCQTNNLPLLHSAAAAAGVVASCCHKIQLRRRPVGLVNMGNTCYFSSAMQNIYQTFLLEVLLNELYEKMMTNYSFSGNSQTTYELCIRIQITQSPKSLCGKDLRLRLTVEPGGVCETEVKKDGTTDEVAVAIPMELNPTPGSPRPVVKLEIFYKEFKGLHTVMVSNRCPTFKEPLSCRPSDFTLQGNNVKLTYNVTATLIPSLLTPELLRFYKHMTSKGQTGLSATYRPEQLFVKLGHRSLRFFNQRQQDSHELLRHLMDAVKEEEKEYLAVTDSSNQLTTVDKVFGGQFLTIFNCQHCDMPYHLFEPFLDLSLPVVFNEKLRSFPYNGNNQQPTLTHSDTLTNEYKTAVYLMKERLTGNIPYCPGDGKHLLDLFKFYTSQEELAEYLCLECNEVMRGNKETLIYNPPAVLTIHFKRFEQSGSQYTKVNEHVRFDTVLDLSPFCSKFSQYQSSSQTIVYHLYGVIVHYGSLLSGGHYIAYIRSRTVDVNHTRKFIQKEFFDRGKFTTKESFVKLFHTQITQVDITDCQAAQTPPSAADIWFEINDSSVKLIKESEVLNKDAFLLFYERVL